MSFSWVDPNFSVLYRQREELRATLWGPAHLGDKVRVAESSAALPAAEA